MGPINHTCATLNLDWNKSFSSATFDKPSIAAFDVATTQQESETCKEGPCLNQQL